MAWQSVTVRKFGDPDVLETVEHTYVPQPEAGQVRIKVLAAGCGFTDTFIRRGRYPDFKGPLPFTPGYELVGIIDAQGPGVTHPALGQRVADLCVTGGYTQYAIRPADVLIPLQNDVDPAEAVCIPLAYLTAYQMLTRYRKLRKGSIILVIGASGTVGTALLDLARHFGLHAIGTCSARNMPIVAKLGATPIDYRTGDFVQSVRKVAPSGVDAAFDAIGGGHFARSFACLARGGLMVGYGSQSMAEGRGSLLDAAIGLLRLKLYAWSTPLSGGRTAAWYAIISRRKSHPQQFRADMEALFQLLQSHAIHPIVIDRLPLSAARQTHERIEAGGLGGKIVLLPWG